jgi:N-acetylglucosaminyldiphosphoundecaprenol N-acetyl-beta-D-mannosaminyltransferase
LRKTSLRGESVYFDGFDVWQKGAKQFIEKLLAGAKAREKTLAFYLNAHTYRLACADEDYRTILSRAAILYPDGMSIVWALRLLCGERVERMTGVDFFETFIQHASAQGVKLYFLGGRPGVAASAAKLLSEKYPTVQIVGTHHGYLTELTQIDDVLSDIQSSGTDIVLVGMGSPGQENFAVRYASRMSAPVIWTVGALFDYYAGMEKIAPRWMGRIGLEWLYRLYRDP